MSDVRFRRLLVTALSMGLVLSACGGGGDTSEETVAPTDQDQGSDQGGSIETPTIDSSAMPPAGEAHVEVDGQTFVFKQSEMLEGPFACEIREDGITINFQSDRHDLLVQGATQESGEIVARATVAPETVETKYSASAGGGEGAVAADGTHVLFVADFDATPTDDPASFNDVGQGTISVTCP